MYKYTYIYSVIKLYNMYDLFPLAFLSIYRDCHLAAVPPVACFIENNMRNACQRRKRGLLQHGSDVLACR